MQGNCNTIFLVCICLLIVPVVKGQQNLVPNGSFEDTSGCPTNYSHLHFTSGWDKYTDGTPDFFHTCGNGTVAGIPSNFRGSQHPANGKAYAGLFNISGGDYKEYLARPIPPLTPGSIYEVSMSVSLGENSSAGTNDLGVFFYDEGPTLVSTLQTLNRTPQISYTGYSPIVEMSDWVRLKQVFRADSAYDNMVIGGFINRNSQNILRINTSQQPSAYYYIDSVVIIELDSFAAYISDTVLCAGDTLEVNYTAYGNFQSNNVFTVQLSDASGSFANPVDIGSVAADTSGSITCIVPAGTADGSGYRVRVTSTNQAGISKINDRDIVVTNVSDVTAENNSPVCSGDTLLLTASGGGLNYSWSGPAGFMSNDRTASILNPAAANAGMYYLSVEYNGCTSMSTTTVVVNDGYRAENLIVNSNSPVCEGALIKLDGSADGSDLTFNWFGPGNYSSSGENAELIATVAAAGDYIFSVKSGNCTVSETVNVVVKEAPDPPLLASNSPLSVGQRLQLEFQNPVAGASIFWKGPQAFTSEQQNPAINNVDESYAGNYLLTTILDSCAATDTIEVIVTDVADSNKLIVYPSPNNGTFYIEGIMSTDDWMPMDVVSVSGQLIFGKVIRPINKKVSEKIELEGRLHTGLYFVRILVYGEVRIFSLSIRR